MLTDALPLQYWPLLLGLAGLVVVVLAQRGHRRRHIAQVAQNTERAARLGMQCAAPLGPGGDEGIVDETTHRYSGTTQGVVWLLEAARLAQQEFAPYRSSDDDQPPITRWTAPAHATGGGFLLLMNLQNAAHAPAPERAPAGSGLLAALVDGAAALALQTYVSAAFGRARAQQHTLHPQQYLPMPEGHFGHAYRAFGDRPALLARLNPRARSWLLRGHNQHLALLWDAQGLSLRWIIAPVSLDQVAACAEFGAVLVGLMNDTEAQATTETPA